MYCLEELWSKYRENITDAEVLLQVTIYRNLET